MMKSFFVLLKLLIAFLVLAALVECHPEKPKLLPTVTVSSVANITDNSASTGGEVTDDGGDQVSGRGICWSSSNSEPSTADSKTSDGTGKGIFLSSLKGLSPGISYHLRAYATNSVGTAYSGSNTFKTLSAAPILTTSDLNSISSTSFNSGGNISADGGDQVTSRGVCWSINQNPTIADNKTTDGAGTGSFTSSVAGLSPGITYYVRAYAINSIGIGYGNQLSTRTSAVMPTITTTLATSITSVSATGGGNVTSDGGGAVTARGVCWSSVNTLPTISDSKTSDGTGTGNFTSTISGLTASTTYYVRAYATNMAGTAYGSQITVTTLVPQLPMLATSTVTSVTTNSAVSGGSISFDGGAAVTVRGICWSSSPSPTTSLSSKTSDGSGLGAYPSSILGLSPGKTYYVRAYAMNSAGTAYGNEVVFTAKPELPIVTTNMVTEIAPFSAITGGNVTYDGGAAETLRGVCWSTAAMPTTALSTKTSDGAGAGTFTSFLTSLSSGTTYYLRAYAVNSAGTAYGNQVNFTTDVVDADGNSYKAVVIGTQIWMEKNLMTTRFSDLSAIPLVTDSVAWRNLSASAYCWYNNDAGTYKSTYGALYDYYSVKTGKLCPTGWHVPSDAEWTSLTDFLGGGNVAGGKLKETGTSHWYPPNEGATNLSGFTAMPGGRRMWTGEFGAVEYIGSWWSTTDNSVPGAYFWSAHQLYTGFGREGQQQNCGFSVRCLKD